MRFQLVAFTILSFFTYLVSHQVAQATDGSTSKTMEIYIKKFNNTINTNASKTLCLYPPCDFETSGAITSSFYNLRQLVFLLYGFIVVIYLMIMVDYFIIQWFPLYIQFYGGGRKESVGSKKVKLTKCTFVKDEDPGRV